jgi:single-strand DNA-binding protein
MSVNKAILIGNLGADPELRYTPSGKAVATFRIATTERWVNQEGESSERTIWHNIVVWGKQAENVKQYLRKGRQVFVEGRIVNRSYDDREGNKRYVSEIVAQNVQFLGTRADAAEETPIPQAAVPDTPPPADNSSADDDDLPF